MSLKTVLQFGNRLGKAYQFFHRNASTKSTDFQSIRYNVEGRVAHIVLNRPERMNAIDNSMPGEIRSAVEKANLDANVRAILLYGNKVFCSGYDLKIYAEAPRGTAPYSQNMPWDPYLDFQGMNYATECFMSVWRSSKPVVCKIKDVAIGGGSDLALCCDVTFADENARIGYPPSRVWGCPTTAMWVYRVGIEMAKRILFTGEVMSGSRAAQIGLIGEALPLEELDKAVENFLERIVSVPTNQLFFQKQVINDAIEQMGLLSTQRLATFFDGMTRHTAEGVRFQERCHKVGFKKAVMERDRGIEELD